MPHRTMTKIYNLMSHMYMYLSMMFSKIDNAPLSSALSFNFQKEHVEINLILMFGKVIIR